MHNSIYVRFFIILEMIQISCAYSGDQIWHPYFLWLNLRQKGIILTLPETNIDQKEKTYPPAYFGAFLLKSWYFNFGCAYSILLLRDQYFNMMFLSGMHHFLLLPVHRNKKKLKIVPPYYTANVARE